MSQNTSFPHVILKQLTKMPLLCNLFQTTLGTHGILIEQKKSFLYVQNQSNIFWTICHKCLYLKLWYFSVVYQVLTS